MTDTLKNIFRLNLVNNYNHSNINKSIENFELIKNRLDVVNDYDNDIELKELSNNSLRYYFIDYLLGDCYYRYNDDINNRIEILLKSKELYFSYLNKLKSIGVITNDLIQHSEYNKSNDNDNIDPFKRRQLKIEQFKFEKSLKNEVEVYKSLLRKSDSQSDFDCIFIDKYTSDGSNNDDDDDDDDEDDDDNEILREYIIRLLKYLNVISKNQIQSIEMELDLLITNEKSKMNNDVRQPERNNNKEDNEIWKIDEIQDNNTLLDKNGKPLKPFVLLPSTSSTSTRQQLKSQVFQPSHRLPTMTIDEYLNNEYEMGNVLQGGNENEPTSKDKLKLKSEMDGSKEGEESIDKLRIDDENWKIFTDENEKGSGNKLMNKG